MSIVKKIIKLFLIIFTRSSYRANTLIRVMCDARIKKYNTIRKIAAISLQSHGVFVSPKAEIGRGVRLPHPIGIVIGEGVRIGQNVTIYQNVTLGARRSGDWSNGRYPSIGDNTVIYCGAVIIGDIKIGKNCVIAANSTVLEDFPDHSVIAGTPAKLK